MLTIRAATIAALALALVAAPPGVGAQQPGKPARLGVLYEEVFRRAGNLVARILKGARPAPTR